MSNEQTTGGSAGGGVSRPPTPMPNTANDMPNEDELEDALLWAAQGFPPRNEQTVGEAFRSDGLARLVGIDPDMSVSELQRRLRIAERVLSCNPETDLAFYRSVRRGDGNRIESARQLLAWLTREDDQ